MSDWRERFLDDEPVDHPQRKPLAETELDITPMIDITFLLLIFFLVASTPDAQTAVELARARHGAGVSEQSSVIFTIAVNESGDAPADVYLADGRVEGAKIEGDADAQAEAIRAAVLDGRRNGKVGVIVKAEKTVRHRDVSRVAAAAALNGMLLHLAVYELE